MIKAALLGYWLIGCALVGQGWAAELRDCGKITAKPGEGIEAALIWPAAVFGVLSLPRDFRFSKDCGATK